MKLLGLSSAIFACVLLCGGCGSSRATSFPVVGTVTLDGKPVEKAAIIMMPAGGGRSAYGSTDANGKFEMTTFEAGDGALPGDYGVAIVLKNMKLPNAKESKTDGDSEMGGMPKSGVVRPPAVEWIVPERYSNVEKSGLTVKVEREMEPLVFDLSTKAK